MSTIIRGDGDGDGARPRGRSTGAGPRRGRSWWEVMHPEGSEGTWRDLPRLLLDSLKLVWAAGRNVFLLTSTLQLVTALGIAVQLFLMGRSAAKEVRAFNLASFLADATTASTTSGSPSSGGLRSAAPRAL